MEAECTECATAFVIPTLESLEQPVEPTSDAIQQSTEPEQASEIEPEINSADDMADTGTVKIDRASIGMLPDVADQFKVDLGTMESNPGIDMSTDNTSEEAEESQSDDIPDLEIPPKPQKKWWQFWK